MISQFFSLKWKANFRCKSLMIFLAFYLFATFLVIPSIAPFFGREPVEHSQKIRPTNYMTVLLNRNYVVPSLNELLTKTSNRLKNSNVRIHYLDANFPFINKFPLLPHLSHNDGEKIDLSLIYETDKGKLSDSKKSVSGYGVFEEPTPNERNQISQCFEHGYFQYDYPKYVTFGSINKELVFSEKGTKKLIKALLKNNNLGKLFIEPHLKQRLRLKDKRVRYHGCKAVRHDDHIHVQLK